MKMSLVHITFGVAVIVSLLVAGRADAATITFVGSVEGTQVVDWRTASTAKTLDIDGDNVLGSTLGAVHWTKASTGEVSDVAGAGGAYGWDFDGAGSQFTNAGYTDIDHITLAPTNTDAGIALTSFTFQLWGPAANYTGKTVRVGVMHDVLTSAEWAADTFKGLRLTQVLGGVGDSGIVSLRGGAGGNGVPEMYFFDMVGVNPGDQFTLFGLNNVGGTSSQSGYIGPVSWDVAVVPSPAALPVGLGIIGLMVARRRR